MHSVEVICVQRFGRQSVVQKFADGFVGQKLRIQSWHTVHRFKLSGRCACTIEHRDLSPTRSFSCGTMTNSRKMIFVILPVVMSCKHLKRISMRRFLVSHLN